MTRTLLFSRLAFTFAMLTMFFLASTASAQITPATLFQYPGVSNNTTGLSNTSLSAQGVDGNIYMTDQLDGQFGLGSVFNISTSGEFTSFYSFCEEGSPCATNGALPFGGVTLGPDGNFYGTVQNGGTHGFGQVFKLTPKGVRTTVYDFTGANPGDGGPSEFAVFLASDNDLWCSDERLRRSVQAHAQGQDFELSIQLHHRLEPKPSHPGKRR